MGTIAKRMAEKARRQRVLSKGFALCFDPAHETEAKLIKTAEDCLITASRTMFDMGCTAEEMDELIVDILLAMARQIGERQTLTAFNNAKRMMASMAEEAELDRHIPIRATNKTMREVSM